MRKIYVKPETMHFAVEPVSMVCATVMNKTYRLTPYAEWGDKGQYAPEDWINEKHTPGIPWPAVGVTDDTDDLTSRGKGSLWDDDDFDD